MPFYSFVLSIPHCRNIQIVCSACCMVLQDNNTEVNSCCTVQYVNVCCAININVYNIFYNTEEADLIVWYELTKWTYREKCSFRNVLAHNLYVCLFLIYIGKALKGFTVNRCAMYIQLIYSLLCARGTTQQCNTYWCEFKLPAFVSFSFFFSKGFHRHECW